MESILRLGQLIETEVSNVNWPAEPNNLYEPLRYFLKLGGKRMRPVLTLMAAEMFGVKANDAIPAALGVELFHNFTLIHDDIMDAAPLRRAKETVHQKWNTNIAILSGDVLMVKAYQEICRQNPQHLSALMNVFNKTAVEVCEGQQMDMDFEERQNVAIEEYLEMIRLKTSVLLGCALEMGGIVASAAANDLENIYRFGQDLGLAFQIKDDWLDLYGDPEKFGKQIGGDVISNKKTLMYLLAKKAANPSQLAEFESLEKESNFTLKVEKVRLLFDELNVPARTKEYMHSYYKKAMESLAAVDVSKERKADLEQLAHYLMEREN